MREAGTRRRQPRTAGGVRARSRRATGRARRPRWPPRCRARTASRPARRSARRGRRARRCSRRRCSRTPRSAGRPGRGSSAGRQTAAARLPMPVPANATMLPTSSTAKAGANARTRWPAVMSSSASTMPLSRPMPRATRGAMNPETANRIGGSVPSSPTPMVEIGTSTRMSARIGEIPATAWRRVRATRTMPSSAAVRPAHSGRGRPSGILRV